MKLRMGKMIATLTAENHTLRTALTEALNWIKDNDLWDRVTDGMGDEGCFMTRALNRKHLPKE